MPRGSKQGERRGGRQRATPNKRTVLADRILAVASANPTASCDEIVAILVKDQVLPASSRVAVAREWFAAAARERLAELRKSRVAAHPGAKSHCSIANAALSAPPRPEPDERTLAEHPFQDLPVVEEEDFIEFVEVPRFIIGNPNYPQKEAAHRLEAASPKR